MATLHTAKKSRAGHPITCGKCDTPITPGTEYRWWAFYRSGRHIRCMQPDCTPAPSELDSSKMSGAYAAIEAAEKTINASGDVDEIGQALEDCASEIEGVRDEYQDSYDSLPDSLQQSSSGEEINSKIESLDTFSGLLADAADEARNADGVQEAMDLAISKLDEFEL